MMLSDKAIREAMDRYDLITPPPVDRQIQPASVDLCIDKYIRDLHGNVYAPSLSDGLISLDSYEVYLGSTIECVTLPNDLAARVEGKSSWARRGLMIHFTAGFIDPGFSGQITLEMVNLGRDVLTIAPGALIAQICFYQLDRAVDRPYGHPALGSKYQDQRGPTPCRNL